MAGSPTLLGRLGRLLRAPKRELTRRTVRPTLVGLRRPQQWRSVITDLTPERLRVLYHAVAQGTWCPDWWELAEEMEERDLHLRGVLQQRLLRAAGAPVDVVPASPAARDVALADEVRTRVLHGPGWHDMLLDLLDAVAKGISCQEIVWGARAGRLAPVAYHRIDPRWLVWDDTDGETPYVIGEHGAPGAPAGAGSALGALPLEPAKYIYHRHRSKSGLPTRGGLAYSVATMYLLKSGAVRDWWAFAESYGLPVRVGKYGPDASDDDIDLLVQAVSMLAADAGCVIPDSMLIEFANAARSGGTGAVNTLHETQARWCDAQVSKAVVGQTMTADDGASLSQARVHEEVREDIVADDVRQMCATLTAAVVAPYCALNHAPRAAGWPRLAVPDDDAVDVAAMTTAARSGLRIPAKWMRERLGVPEPREGEEVLTGLPVGSAGAGAGEGEGEGGGAPPPAAHAHALHAAEDPWGEGEWLAVADDLAASVVAALDAAADAEEFLALASEAGAPAALAEDLAHRCFGARVDGETDPDTRG